MPNKPKRQKELTRGISDRLRSLIEEKGFSIRSLSTLSDIPKSSLNNWVSGESIPTDFDALLRLSNILETNLSFILCGVNDSRPTKPSVTEVFKLGDVIFDGYLKVRVERVIPRGEEDGPV